MNTMRYYGLRRYSERSNHIINQKLHMRKRQGQLKPSWQFAALLSVALASSTVHAQEQPSTAKKLTDTTKDFLSDPARTGSLVGSILAGAAIANPLAPIVGSVAGFLIGKQTPYSRKNNNTTLRQDYANRSLVPDDDTQALSLNTDNPINLIAPSQFGNTAQPSLQGAIATVPRESAPENLSQSQMPDHTNTLLLTEESQSGYPRLKEQGPHALPHEARTGYPFSRPAAAMPATRPFLPSMGKEATSTSLGNTGNAHESVLRRLAKTCGNVQLSTQPVSSACYYFSQ